MEEYDTIIIGGGLAGCCLGKLLLEKKEKVLIIEKRNSNHKDKLCGGLMTNKSYQLLKKIYGNAVNDLCLNEIHEFEIRNESSILKFNSPRLYSIFRNDLDTFVMEQYKKSGGGNLIDGTTYEKIDFENKILYINNQKIKYTNLVGADGIFSQLRKDITKRQQNKNFALEAYIDKKDTTLQIRFLNCFKGYAWIIPNCKNTILGIIDVYGNVRLKDELITLFHLNEEKIKGAFLPTGDDILLERNGVYFIGDAAGLIAPITGEGIYYALFSAYQLSKNSNTMLYQKKMKKEIRTIKKILKTKKLVYNDTLRAFLFKKYNQSKVINKCINAFVQKIL